MYKREKQHLKISLFLKEWCVTLVCCKLMYVTGEIIVMDKDYVLLSNNYQIGDEGIIFL